MGELQSAVLSEPEAVPSTTMAVQQINAEGGVHGHPLQLLSCNTNADNSTAIACARQAVSDQVAAVVSLSTFEGASVLPVLAAAKIPAVASYAYTTPDLQSPAAFPSQDALSIFKAVGQQAAGIPGVKKIAVLGVDTQAGRGAAQLTVQAAEAAGASARLVPVPASASDVSSEVQNALSGSDAIALAVPGQTAAPIITAVRQQDPNMPIDTSSGVYSQTGLPISQLEGLYVAGQTPSLDATNDPVVAQFKAAYDKYGNGNKVIFTDNGLQGWTSVQLFAKVASGVSGDVTGPSMYAAMNQVKGLDFLWLKDYTVDPSSTNRMFNKYAYFSRVQGGTLTPVQGPVLLK